MELTEKNYKEDFCAKKISVIIPMYNAEKYIKKTLNSIIEQSYQNWEIIIIENGSEDKSPDIIREYEKKYPEIRMIKGPGKGPGPARNRGLKLAKGDYIVFADADDYLPDTEIFRKYISIAEPTGADIVVSNYARLWEDKILPAADLDFRGRRILLVEDNELNREIAVALLSEYGFQVDTAEDGAEAVEKVKNSRPGDYDLVLMDVQMPVMNGYEATERIRSLDDPSLAGITILAMTANAFDEDRKKALECRMDGFLSKPIVIEELISTLQKNLDQVSGV